MRPSMLVLFASLVAGSACASSSDRPPPPRSATLESPTPGETGPIGPGNAHGLPTDAPEVAPPLITDGSCDHGGMRVPHQHATSDGCNTCTCRGGSLACTLLACEILMEERIAFGRDSAQVSADAEPTLRNVVDAMNHPAMVAADAVVTIVGHSMAGEGRRGPVEAKRAEAVRAKLIALGAPRHRLALGDHVRGAAEAAVTVRAGPVQDKREWGEPYPIAQTR